MRRVEADGARRSTVVLGVAFVLLGAWAIWFLFVPVTVYEVTDSARLEVGQTVYPVAAPVSGMIVATHLDLGREVKEGEILVELDANALRLDLMQKKARLYALDQELGPLNEQVAAEERALNDLIAAERSRVDEASARSREAQAAAEFASNEAKRQQRLKDNGLATEADVDRSKAEQTMRRAATDASRMGVARTQSEGKNHESDLRASMAKLNRDRAVLAGQRAQEVAGVTVLEHEIERRTIRAPVAGHIGEIAALQIGSVLKEGEKIAAIIPSGRLKVIAEFAPSAAFGHIHEGQSARVKLDGFPWTQYGDLRATVESVASEPRDGKARVELALDPSSNPRIPLQHGLPGSIEIEVERVPAATLVMRAAGQAMRGPITAREETSAPRAPEGG